MRYIKNIAPYGVRFNIERGKEKNVVCASKPSSNRIYIYKYKHKPNHKKEKKILFVYVDKKLRSQSAVEIINTIERRR